MENQKRVKALTEEHGAENMVVLLEFKSIVDEAVYEDQIGMMEMVLDVDEIIKEMNSIREQVAQ